MRDDKVWFVFDPLSSHFGEIVPDCDAAGAADESPSEDYCLLRRPDGTSVPLRRALRSEVQRLTGGEKTEVRRRTSAPTGEPGAGTQSATPPQASTHHKSPPAAPVTAPSRSSDRRAKLGQWDWFKERPNMRASRVVIGIVACLGYMWMTWEMSSGSEPPSFLVPVLVTAVYPFLVCWVMRWMETRQPKHVFETVLAFDLYQVLSSVAVLVGVVGEAWHLGMVRVPWGHDSSLSSGLLRQLVWWHYHSRVVELCDTFFRISQKKLGTYGALHFYLRLVNIWAWYAACRVGGGDVWFLTVVDSFVVAVRFSCFTLSLLRWKVNPLIDFGLYAPKIKLLRSEHLLQLHLLEFLVLAVHAVYMLMKGNVPHVVAGLQLFVMANSAAVFMDWAVTNHAVEESEAGRVVFSFDSSGWLYLYHFGVAMWIEDNVDIDSGRCGFSGASGGALVAASLSTGVDPGKLAQYVLTDGWQLAGRNPFKLMGAVEAALDKHLPANGWAEPSTDLSGERRRGASGTLRVLLTRVSPLPPFLKGEVVSRFPSWHALFQCLRATCHIPGVGGLLPYPISCLSGWYYDGLLWSSLFVPWRSFHRGDSVIKVSAMGAPGAHIRPSVAIPPWWALFPPSEDALHALMWLGYKDAERFMHGEKKKARGWGCACEVPTKRRGPGSSPKTVNLPEEIRPLLKRLPDVSRMTERETKYYDSIVPMSRRGWRQGFVVLTVLGSLWAFFLYHAAAYLSSLF
eukprot:Hpha_TRINITY_DN14996_c1_g7::TRINITY_DN14996_c1_g7_i1::g.144566::m.144566